MFQAIRGFFSATADKSAARLYIVSILYFSTISASCLPSRTSAISAGPLSNNMPFGSAPGIYPATIFPSGIRFLSFIVSSEPICPVEPMTSTFFILVHIEFVMRI